MLRLNGFIKTAEDDCTRRYILKLDFRFSKKVVIRTLVGITLLCLRKKCHNKKVQLCQFNCCLTEYDN